MYGCILTGLGGSESSQHVYKSPDQTEYQFIVDRNEFVWQSIMGMLGIYLTE